MAQEKKYKLGDLEFETEQEYREAAADLKRIKGLTEKYQVDNPAQAQKILTSIKAHPETFRSPYGRKFVAKLEKAAGVSSSQASGSSSLNTRAESAASAPSDDKKEQKRQKEKVRKEKRQARVREKRPSGTEKGKFQIFTPRNFAIGVVIIACVVVFSIFAPRLFSLNNSPDSNGDIRKNMITAYANSQAELKMQLYTYYYNVVGQTEEEAQKNAEEGLSHYVMDLSDRTISTMSDSEISDIYGRLVEGGDIQNNSFVEPSEITVLKDKLLAAGLSGAGGNGMEGETAVEAAINSMMDYQQRMYYSLCYQYSLLGYSQSDAQGYAMEDMESLFGHVIYDEKMTMEEKQSYFDSFTKSGLIKDNQIVRFSADPTAYSLPELTPAIEVAFFGEKAQAYNCSMISYAPAASVFYEVNAGKQKGYICFRNNGGNKDYIQVDADTSVTAQGDFFMTVGSEKQTGRWFYNQQNIGILINGDSSSLITYVHDLTY